MYTVSDTEEQGDAAKKARMGDGSSRVRSTTIHTIQNTLFDPVRIGKQALDYTNQFRAYVVDKITQRIP